MPEFDGAWGKSHAAAFANANFGSATSRTTLLAKRLLGSASTHLAADFSMRGANLGASRYMRSVAVAFSGPATPVIARLPSPCSFAPRYFANSAAVRFIRTSFSFARKLFGAPIRSLNFDRLERIYRRLSRRASLPALVNPEPLVRMLAHVGFNHSHEARGILTHVRIFIAGAHKLERACELQVIFLLIGVPRQKPRNDRSIRAQRDSCDARCGGSWFAKKIHEDTFVEQCVRVGQNADRAAFAKHFQNSARGTVFFDRTIPGKTAIAIDERVYAGIGNGTHQEMKRVTVESMREWRKFPGAHVAGEE